MTIVRGKEQIIEVPADFVIHTFPLRPGLDISIALPRDLSARDVERLQRFLAVMVDDDEDDADDEEPQDEDARDVETCTCGVVLTGIPPQPCARAVNPECPVHGRGRRPH